MNGYKVFGLPAEQLHIPVARSLELRFPGVRVWYGLSTRRW
jgi:hypothetical protein